METFIYTCGPHACLNSTTLGHLNRLHNKFKHNQPSLYWIINLFTYLEPHTDAQRNSKSYFKKRGVLVRSRSLNELDTTAPWASSHFHLLCNFSCEIMLLSEPHELMNDLVLVPKRPMRGISQSLTWPVHSKVLRSHAASTAADAPSCNWPNTSLESDCWQAFAVTMSMVSLLITKLRDFILLIGVRVCQ